MAVSNPWQKRATHAPRYEKMKPDPFARFSKTPGALATLNTFRSKLVSQGDMREGALIPARFKNDALAVIAPYVESTGLGELKDEASVRLYRKRASDNNMLTVDEAESLVEHSLDKVMRGPRVKGTAALEVKDASDVRREYLDDVAKAYDERPGTTQFIPFLVNITWSFISEKVEGRRKSPGVDYSVEGVFYAVKEEEAIAAGQQFINNYIRPAVSGGGDRVIDASQEGPDGHAAATSIIGAEAIEGAALTKAQVEEMAFDPQVRAFFTSLSGKVSIDQNFRDPGYRYRIVKGSFETI